MLSGFNRWFSGRIGFYYANWITSLGSVIALVAVALLVLELMVRSGKSLKELRQGMEKFPQTMINVPVSPGGQKQLGESLRIQQAVAQVESELEGKGRVILRPSGTEPLIRVTLEGADRQLVESLAAGLAETVRSELGA